MFFFLVNLIVIFKVQPVFAQDNDATMIVDQKALTCFEGTYGNSINGQSFQQDALTSYKGWQYIAYYNGARQVCLGRRKLTDYKWETINFDDYRFSYLKNQDNNTHNVISIGLCTKDGTIHLSFDQHAGPLHYRVSIKDILDNPERVQWTSKLFKPIVNYLEIGKPIPVVSYPTFISTPQGNLLFAYRNGYSSNGDCLIGQYDASSGKWTDPHVFISRSGNYQDPFKGDSKNRNAYLNNLSYDHKGVLHISWTWRENVATLGNRDICYAYSKDNGNSWCNHRNDLIAVHGAGQSKSIDALSAGITVRHLDRGWGVMNQQSQVADKRLKPHIVMYHKKSHGGPGWALMENGAYFHYYQKEGIWQQNQLPFMGNRPKLICDRNNNLFLVFVRKDHFEAKNQGAPLVVVRATYKSGWKDWKEVYVSKATYFNEPQLDLARWLNAGILSVMLQSPPAVEGQPSALHVLEIEGKHLNP
ncbi:BNR repeat-containing protein [Pedobacter africanus]|nr:BNR repeat-containing protein [Pedobacter africanus]